MKKIILTASVFLFAAGCGSLRFAPSEKQKQNAWLHNRTMAVSAQSAKAEGTSHELQALTQLGEQQSRAFVSYYGLPEQFPPADTVKDILAESNFKLAVDANLESSERPDEWEVADSAIDLGIGIFALFGGVYGTQLVRFLKNAKTKTQALKEIIAGNELFKKQNESASAAFKQAQSGQSPQTRQIVTEMKVGS
jgi:hypothetical protein